MTRSLAAALFVSLAAALFVSLAAALFVSLALAGCARPAEESAAAEKARPTALPPVAVEVAAVRIQKMPRYLTLTGSVAPDRSSEVAANVSGRISVTLAERGRPVKAGQTLVIVDSRAAGLSAAAAAAQSRLADVNVVQAQNDCDRAELLYAKGALARSEYDRQKTQCKAQLDTSEAARANAQLAAKLAGDTEVRAPFDGIVGERYVNAGEYVMPQTKVASLYALDPVRVSISVPEPAVGLVHEGQTLAVHVVAYPGRDFPAVLRYLGPALRANTRDLIVEARAENKDGALRPGMFATVQLDVGEEALPVVPEDALLVEGTVKRLFLAREGRAYEMVVKSGVRQGGLVSVLEPLDDKTLVIRHPPPGLQDGSWIQVTERAPGAAGAPHAAGEVR